MFLLRKIVKNKSIGSKEMKFKRFSGFFQTFLTKTQIENKNVTLNENKILIYFYFGNLLLPQKYKFI